MNPIIRVRDVSKRYAFTMRNESFDTLRDVVAGAFRSPLRILRRRPDYSSTFWALCDVTFDIHAGEIVGIVGRNGAGKSTLLRVLSRITKPTNGRVDLFGRVGSLLEVGTGFHPELTGRENIFLNGAIMGMRRREIGRKFDEIVAFAEIEKFIDTPVKRYSSGMYMRLAFAVAAHLEPEILLVDEVLAVGDVDFQKKCLGKMNDVARNGRTILFVSHNLAAIRQLCSRTLLLSEGVVERNGPTAEVLTHYLQLRTAQSAECIWNDPMRAPGNQKVRLHAVRIIANGRTTNEVDLDKDISVEVQFWNYVRGIRNLYVEFQLQTMTGFTVLCTTNTAGANALDEPWPREHHEAGLFRATCTVPGNFLNAGDYCVTVYLLTLGPLAIEAEAGQVVSFSVLDTGRMRTAGGGDGWHGVIRIPLPWRTEFLRAFEAEREQVCILSTTDAIR